MIRLKAEFALYDDEKTGHVPLAELKDVISTTFPWDTDRVKAMYVDVMLREAPVVDGKVNYHMMLDDGKAVFRIFATADRCSRLEKEFAEWDEGEGTVEVAKLKDLVNKAFPLALPENKERFLDAVLMEVDGDSVTEDDLLKSDYFYLMAMAEEETIVEKAKTVPPKGPQKKEVTKTAPLGGGMRARWQEVRGGGLVEYMQSSPTLKKGIVAIDFQNPSAPDELYKKGEEQIETDNGFKWWLALDLFKKAAGDYTYGKEWSKAGDALLKVADCQGMLGSPIESAATLVKAADCYKKVNRQLAIKCLNEAVDVYEDQGRTSMFALLHKQIGELYEEEGDLQMAVEYYAQAAEHYCKPEQVKQRFLLNKRIGRLHAMSGNYPEGIKMFEQLAHTVVKDNLGSNPVLGRLEVKEYFFHATLCHLSALDAKESGVQRLDKVMNADKAFRSYEEMDLENIGMELELELCKKLIKAMIKADSDAIREALDIFHMCRTVEPWVNVLLAKVQQNSDDWLAKVEAMTGQEAN